MASKKSSAAPYAEFYTAMQELSNNNTARTFQFNANEAQKARDWQTAMSNTSHQREVADLKAAGLNPVLSANSGAQSYSASSASGTADSSAVNAIANLIQTKMSNDTSMALGRLNAKVGLASAAATKYAAGVSAAAALGASANSAAAQKYAADKNYETQKYATDNMKVNSPIGLIDKYVGPLVGSGKETVWDTSSAYNNPKGQTTMGGGRK